MRMHMAALIVGLLAAPPASHATGFGQLGRTVPTAWLPVAASGDSSRQNPAGGETKQPSPEEIMNSRYPQPIMVADLIGLPVLDYFDATIGYVRGVVRTPAGKIQLVVTQGGWLAGWSSWRARLVAVPIEVVAILGRQLVALEMSRDQFASAPTWLETDGQAITPDETIKIAITRR